MRSRMSLQEVKNLLGVVPYTGYQCFAFFLLFLGTTLENTLNLFEADWLLYAIALPCAPIWIVDTSFTLVEFGQAILRRIFNSHE